MTETSTVPRGEIVQELDGTYEVFPLTVDEKTLLEIFKDCFAEWKHIHFGPLIQGAAWEIRPPQEPRITMMDGYATVSFKDWHFHICIGEHKGAAEELRKIRPTSRAGLYRMLHNDKPTSWGLRLFNGAGEQQITFLLPHPYLSDDQQIMKEPDWSRLALWDRLRQKYLAIGPDPLDRSAPGFVHG